MSSRLKKLAMDASTFQGTIDQTSKKGREILKSLEDLKFTFEQTARLLKNNQEIAQGIIQKRKEIDVITSKLYQIVFDIENMDISLAFNNQNQPVMEDAPTKSPMGEDSVKHDKQKPTEQQNTEQPVPPTDKQSVPPTDKQPDKEKSDTEKPDTEKPKPPTDNKEE